MRRNNNFLVVFTLLIALFSQISICSEVPAENWSYLISPSRIGSALFNVIAENKITLCAVLISACGVTLLYKGLAIYFDEKGTAKKDVPQEQKELTETVYFIADFKAILANNIPGNESTTNDEIEGLKDQFPDEHPQRPALNQALEEMFIDRMKAKFTPGMPIEDKKKLTLAERNLVYGCKGSNDGPMPDNDIRNANLYWRNQGLNRLCLELHQEQQALIIS